MAAILCLTSPDPNTHKPVKISNECQHEIWQKKLEITGDERILQTLSSVNRVTRLSVLPPDVDMVTLVFTKLV